MTPPVSGYVLAGGLSSRMGTDKSLLRLDGVTLLEIALRKVREVCGDAAILCGSTERSVQLAAYGRCVVDRVEASGPLGGLDAALHDAQQEWLLIVPVDVPLLPASALRELMEQATENGKPNVACFDGPERRQPLPVVLHRSTRQVFAVALSEGKHRLMPILRDAADAVCPLGMCVLPTVEITDELTATAWFTNVNTPDDLRSAGELLRAGNDFLPRASE